MHAAGHPGHNKTTAPAETPGPMHSEKRMTPGNIIVASIVILAADYVVDRYFRYRESPHVHGFLNDPSNNWLHNPLRRHESIRHDEA